MAGTSAGRRISIKGFNGRTRLVGTVNYAKAFRVSLVMFQCKGEKCFLPVTIIHKETGSTHELIGRRDP